MWGIEEKHDGAGTSWVIVQRKTQHTLMIAHQTVHFENKDEASKIVRILNSANYR